jgi:hypothetical protein
LAAGYSTLLRTLLGVRWRQLVVCGYPRGGTSLLYNMLSSASEEFRFEEFEVPAEYRMHRLGDVATKFPLDVLNIDRLESLNIHDKRVLVVAMIRDPRDVLTSRHPMVPDRYFIGHDHSWWPQNKSFSEWKFDAPGIVEIHEALDGLQRASPFAFLLLRYEDLVASPDDVQRVIATSFGLDFSGRFQDFHKHKDRHAYRYEGRAAARDPSLVRENKAADTSRAGKWRKPEHRERIIEQFEACPRLFDIVREYGYEADDRWYEELQVDD